MMMKTMMKLASGLGLLMAVGCNGSVETAPSGAGGSSTATTGATTGTMTGGTTGSGGACGGFEDATGAAPVTVRFVNKTGLPVYLPGNCQGVDYLLNPTNGSDGATYSYDSSCLQTCADLQTNPPFVCGLCAPTSYLLDVGATREVTWNGTGLKYEVPMPSTCWAQPQNNGTCPQIVAAPAANYAIQGIGFSSCGPGCTCDEKGICFGYPEGGKAYAELVKFNFPAQNVVEVVFNVCAFGCPGGSD